MSALAAGRGEGRGRARGRLWALIAGNMYWGRGECWALYVIITT